MIRIDIDPILVHLGNLEIKWYGIFYIVGFIIAYYWLNKNRLKLKMSSKEVDDFLLYEMIGLIIGARTFFFLFYSPQTFSFMNFLAVWNGGMSFHGAFLGMIIATILFARKRKARLWAIFDALAIIAPLALAIGRIGNLINHELAGLPFDGAWCMVFPVYDTLCRHPYPLYALLSHLALFVMMLYIYIKNKNIIGTKIPTITFFIGYGILRIITDFWKVDTMFWFLKTGQWLSVFMIIVGVMIYIYSYKRYKTISR